MLYIAFSVPPCQLASASLALQISNDQGRAPSSEAEKTPKRSPAKTNSDSASSTGSAAAPQQGSVEAESGATPSLQPQLIESNEALQALVQRLMDCTDPKAPIAVDTETTDLNPFKAELVGVGVCWGEANDALAYIPIGHKGSDDSRPEQLPMESVLMAVASVGRCVACGLRRLRPKLLRKQKPSTVFSPVRFRVSFDGPAAALPPAQEGGAHRIAMRRGHATRALQRL